MNVEVQFSTESLKNRISQNSMFQEYVKSIVGIDTHDWTDYDKLSQKNAPQKEDKISIQGDFTND